MDAFLIIGHGEESLVDFDKRKKMPPGYTLVTLAECGMTTKDTDICNFVGGFTNPAYEAYVKDPLTNRQIIQTLLKGKRIHIYKEGDSYPELFLQLYGDWVDEDNIVRLSKSGIYKYPIDKDDFKFSDEESICDSMFDYVDLGKYGIFLPDDFDIKKMYRGSIFPTENEAEEIMNTHSRIHDRVKKNLTVSIDTIFEKGGPGIYYHVVCRNPKGVTHPKERINTLFYNKPDIKESYKDFFQGNWTSRANELIAMLEKNKTTTNTNYKIPIFEDTLKQYGPLRAIPGIRRKSILQQQFPNLVESSGSAVGAGTGGKRKSKRIHKHKHKRRKQATRKGTK